MIFFLPVFDEMIVFYSCVTPIDMSAFAASWLMLLTPVVLPILNVVLQDLLAISIRDDFTLFSLRQWDAEAAGFKVEQRNRAVMATR